jgi:uncharacterized protein YwgA
MNLSPRNLILLIVSEFNGKIIGRTLLQKRLYFFEELLQKEFAETAGLQYDSHFYGPYSPLISTETAILEASGFLRGYAEPFGYSHRGFEVKRYSYELSDAGERVVQRIKSENPEAYRRVHSVVSQIKKIEDVDYVNLSIAAKTFYMLKRFRKPLSSKAAVEQAKQFSWQISEEDVERCFHILERLELAQKVSEEPPAGIP